ncbi:MAG: hypothetical protein JXA90_04380 [Planctomycetes bacterium]|nr:hypothetical protein [Planctomycetota bacterium]
MLESLSSEELQFIKAIEKHKNSSGKLFLSWSEVLKILKALGYRKVASRSKGEKTPLRSAGPRQEGNISAVAAPGPDRTSAN